MKSKHFCDSCAFLWLLTFFLAAFSVSCGLLDAQKNKAAWEHEAQNISLVRDNWGIPHVSGKTDANAVFGVIYAQAEDDFNRVETNYFTALGRSAEYEGSSSIVKDLRYRLINNPDSLKALYSREPVWLKKLMRSWADGLN